MSNETQRERAMKLRDLHHGPDVLILANAWDVITARIVESLGVPAIATSSAAIANSLGYPDGEAIPPKEMAAAVRRIANSVSVPVTADMEAGYGQTVEAAVATAGQVIASGAVGFNFEDATGDPAAPLTDASLQAERISAAIGAGEAAGVPLVINARTDSYWIGTGDRQTRIDEAISRGRMYLNAGATCVFVPGAADAETIRELCQGIGGPVNILAGKRVPTISELKALGVARVSVGSGIMRAAMYHVRAMAAEVIKSGTYDAFTRDTISYDDLNSLLKKD